MPFGLRRRLSAVDGQASDRGITMIELTVVMALMGILGGIAVWGLLTYSQAQSMNQTANGLLDEFRAVAQRATSEDRTYCVSIDTTTTYSVWRYSCDKSESVLPINVTPTPVASFSASGNSVLTVESYSDTDTSLAHLCKSGSQGCFFFYPRGNASDGSVEVCRTSAPCTPDSSPKKVITVVGLTGRAYQSS